jgi:hypothetical protein
VHVYREDWAESYKERTSRDWRILARKLLEKPPSNRGFFLFLQKFLLDIFFIYMPNAILSPTPQKMPL